MNKKFLFLLLSILVGSFFYLTSNQPDIHQTHQKKEEVKKEVSPSPVDNECQEAFVFYEEKISTSPDSLTLRFKNVHLKLEDKIYRLRFFYDDGDEGEIPTYQVFLEDDQEYADLIETSPLKPGPKYESLLKAQGEQIYEESGQLNERSDEYIHLENKKVLRVISDKSECVRD